jgi:hypothetical protein
MLPIKNVSWFLLLEGLIISSCFYFNDNLTRWAGDIIFRNHPPSMEVEIVSVDPLMLYINNFVTTSEIDELLSLA